jgi:transcriptional regulator with XRE-family HTH domain
MNTTKRTPYELREARKKAGLTLAKASSLAKISQKTWEQWEFSPESTNSRRTPEYAFQFLRCYRILKKHNLLEELLKPEEDD